MNRLSPEQRAAVVSALVEGCSIRSTVRMTGVAKNTVAKLLADLGTACLAFHDATVRGLTCQRVQADEAWSFVYAKAKNVPLEKLGEAGDVWTWVAMDADTKLAVDWRVGGRDAAVARDFMEGVAKRIGNRMQLTTDAHGVYLSAVFNAFGFEVDYAQLVKLYGADRSGEARYSPAVCTGCRKIRLIGAPDKKHVSTSYIERQNLTLRMSMRRFTRLTNAFSKKVENHAHAVALHFVHYNFCRKHMTLGQTPAQAAGLADHAWTLAELVGLLERSERPVRRAS